MKTEHVLQAAAEAFRYEFESNLRQRLLDVATAEIEHIVKEVSAKVTHTISAEYSNLDRTYGLNHRVSIRHDHRTP